MPAVAARVETVPPLELTPSEMTERQRAVVERGVRRRLVAAAFGDERALVMDGISGNALDAAIVDTIAALEADRTVGLTSRLVALLDLLELDGRHVPFDAQTRFYDAFVATLEPGSHLDPAVAALAMRLGFAARLGSE